MNFKSISLGLAGSALLAVSSIANSATATPSLAAFADCNPGTAFSGYTGPRTSPATNSCSSNVVTSESVITYSSMKLRTVADGTAPNGQYFAAGSITDTVVINPNDNSLLGQSGKLFLTYAFDATLSAGAEYTVRAQEIVHTGANQFSAVEAPIDFEYNAFVDGSLITLSGESSIFKGVKNILSNDIYISLALL